MMMMENDSWSRVEAEEFAGRYKDNKNIMRQANQREHVMTMTINMDTCSCISSATFPAACSFAQKNAFKPAERFRQLFHQAIVLEMLCNGVSQRQTRRPAETKDYGISQGIQNMKVAFTFKIHTYINPPFSHLSALSPPGALVLLFKKFMYRYIAVFWNLHAIGKCCNKRTFRSPPWQQQLRNYRLKKTCYAIARKKRRGKTL
jgi:hypothetical protein